MTYTGVQQLASVKSHPIPIQTLSLFLSLQYFSLLQKQQQHTSNTQNSIELDRERLYLRVHEKNLQHLSYLSCHIADLSRQFNTYSVWVCTVKLQDDRTNVTKNNECFGFTLLPAIGNEVYVVYSICYTTLWSNRKIVKKGEIIITSWLGTLQTNCFFWLLFQTS